MRRKLKGDLGRSPLAGASLSASKLAAYIRLPRHGLAVTTIQWSPHLRVSSRSPIGGGLALAAMPCLPLAKRHVVERPPAFHESLRRDAFELLRSGGESEQ